MEKLQNTDFREKVMIDKINEIIDWLNEVEEELFEGVSDRDRQPSIEKLKDRVKKLERHYHAIEAQDRDITTGPRYEL